ncbi:hypothetical protein OJ965_02150 (plasmid) [Pantoea anthophila]|uniref:hypothetical protein n=1 Tax=Pantoea anthophila TaxID=470931 RepID=UPI0022356BBA|nr:hypothetical protein [Pantoea anthophila]UZH01347.1 hypothetical protein OJ965_02150 [Pantoea anthophila]
MEPKTKIGEAQVQQAFVEHLKYKITKKFGPEYPYNVGAFNGSQDKKYADYFAGVNAINILIEFKEFKSEISSESAKPLRAKLCNTISDLNLPSSLNAHFISWRLDNSSDNKIVLKIDTYLPTVCPLFNKSFSGNNEKFMPAFVDDFLDMKAGISNEGFELYINELSDIAGGEGDASFYGTHINFDPVDGLELTIFTKISELIEFSKNLNLSKLPSPEDDEPTPDRGGPRI